MQIISATIHELKKLQHTHGEEVVSSIERDGLLPVDATLTNVCAQTIAFISKNGNNTGTFGDSEDIHRFPIRLKEYRDGTHSFEAFSKISLAIIAEHMANASAANGGYAFYLHYKQGNEEHLLVVMLKLKEGAGISDALALLPTLIIDTSKLHEAARVNLTRWESGMQPYLTFVKGRGADKVTEYFRTALACTGYTSSQHHTEQVIAAAKDYIHSLPGLSKDERNEKWGAVRTSLHTAFSSNAEEIVLDAIAVAIEPTDPDAFKDFIASEDSAGKYSFNHTFKPHSDTFRQLKRIRGKVGTISVSFDVEDVRQGRVVYDEEMGALIIRSVSDKVRQEAIESATAGA